MRLAVLAAVTLAAVALLAGSLIGFGNRDASAQNVSVTIGDFYFCDPGLPTGTCQTVINPGDTIIWDYISGSSVHTVTDCGPSCDSTANNPVFDSGNLTPGQNYSATFPTSGSYAYHCRLHPTLMRATVVVRGNVGPTQAPTPEPTAEETPEPTAAPSPEPTGTPVPTVTLSPTRTPRTNTPTPSPERTTVHIDVDDGGGGFPLWGFLVIGIFVASALAGGAWLAARSIANRPPQPPQGPRGPRPPLPPRR